MGVKSKVRSMQRGAQKRDRGKPCSEPDYAGRPPSIRQEDRAHLGLTSEASARLVASLKEKILGYARAGFRKPADVSRLLNKEKIRTLSGTEWNPRLVYFLLRRIYGARPKRPKATPSPSSAKPRAQRKTAGRSAVPPPPPLNLLPPLTTTVPVTRRYDTMPLLSEEEPEVPTEKPARKIKVRPPSDPVPLSADEMARRLDALKAHFADD